MAYIVLILFSALMLYVTYSDLTSYTLPNFISILLVVGFCLVMLIIQPPLAAFGWHVGVGAILFVVGFVLFATGLFGGGDVKVIAALGLWLGPSNVLPFITMMAILGGVLALALLIFRKIKIPQNWLKNSAIAGLHSKEEGIPYGVAIAFAALIEFPKTEILARISAL
ncbi:MAG: prepilin peptidase [Hyphomicrobiales bacterium]